jgi:hypothetical protein
VIEFRWPAVFCLSFSAASILHAEQNLHRAGELLWQGDGVHVHEHEILNDAKFQDDVCDPSSRKANPQRAWHKVSVVFQGDENTVIDYGDHYRDLLLRGVIPALETRCGFLSPNIMLFNFVSDITIGLRGGPGRVRVYRSAERWRELRSMPFEEQYAKGGHLTDEPLSECTAELQEREWTLECTAFEDYFGSVPLTGYQSIAGMIASEHEMNNLSEGELRRLAAYEVEHSEANAVEAVREWHERRAREWNRDVCAEANATTQQGPSARDVCHAIRSHLSEANVLGGMLASIWTAFSDKPDRPTVPDFRIGSFELGSCTRDGDTNVFVCDYSFDLKATGGSNSVPAFVRAMLVGGGNARSTFEERSGRWQYVKPEPAAYEDLPCCWLGDIRVRWNDCRVNC